MKYIEFEEIDSTNTYIHDRYQELDDDTIVRAHYQTHGRGRSNHIWEANKNEQLLFSYYMKQNASFKSVCHYGLCDCDSSKNETDQCIH